MTRPSKATNKPGRGHNAPGIPNPPASPLLVLTPGSFSLACSQGGTVAPQTVAITNGVSAGTLAPTLGSPSQSWLTASLVGTAITLTADATALPVGVSTATLAVSDGTASNSPQTITVSVTVQPVAQPVPLLHLSATAFSFSATAGSADPHAQECRISNVGDGILAGISRSITYGSGAGWLSTHIGAGTGNSQSIDLIPATGALTAGTYTATVSIASVGAGNTPQDIGVTFTVAAAPTPTPTLHFAPTSLTFADIAGGTNPAAQSVAITNSSTGTLAACGRSIAYTSGSGWLTATLGGSGNAQTIGVQPTTGALTAGTYQATITITSAGAVNTPQTTPVTFVVSSVAGTTPTMSPAPTSLAFFATAGATSPATQDVVVTNTGAGSMVAIGRSVAYVGTTGWLSTTLAPGTASNTQTVTVTATLGSLAAGVYTATLSLSSAGASNTPVAIPVTLTVFAASGGGSTGTVRLSTATLPSDITQNTDGTFTPTGWRVLGDVPARYLVGGAAPVRYVGTSAGAFGSPTGGITTYAYTPAGYAAAVAAAARGDVIVVDDYTTASSAPLSWTTATPVNYPAHSGTTPIVVMSRAVYFGTFPRAYGERLAAGYADRAHCAVLTYDATAVSTLSVWHQFPDSATASHWRFVGMEFWNRASSYLSGGATATRLNDIFRIGTTTRTTSATAPNNIWWDRCAIHGDWSTAPLRRAIMCNGDYIGAIGCEIGEAYLPVTDTQAFYALNCDGPIHLENNRLRDSCEIFMTGGATIALGSPHLPSDIAIIDCLFIRDPTSKGTSLVTTVKNHWEFKVVRRALITGVVQRGHWDAGQAASAKSKTTNQAGSGTTWAESVDVTFWHFDIDDAPEAFAFAGHTEDPISTAGSQRHDVFNGLVRPLDVAPYTTTSTSGALGRFLGPFAGCVIEHVTGFMSWNTATGSPGFAMDVSRGDQTATNPGNPITGFVFKNNITGRGPSAFRFVSTSRTGQSTLSGTNGLAQAAPGYVWANNLIVGLTGTTDNPAAYPQGNGNLYTTSGTNGGTVLTRADIRFTSDGDPNVYGDWTLQPSSPAVGAADDGEDMGVIWSLLTARTARAISGAAS